MGTSRELHATWDDRRTAKVSWNSCFSATRVPLHVSRQHEDTVISRELTFVRMDAKAFGSASCPDGPR